MQGTCGMIFIFRLKPRFEELSEHGTMVFYSMTNKQTNLSHTRQSNLSHTRQFLKMSRSSLSVLTQKKHAKQLLYQCQKQAVFRLSFRVALYQAVGGEINPKLIVKFLQKQGKKVYFPVLNKDKLLFSQASKQQKINRFAISEPKNIRLNAHKMSLILMPLLGFDKDNNRLGMGGGFYDKTLAFTQKQDKFVHPKCHGLAHKIQQIDVIKPNTWDIKPISIITN